MTEATAETKKRPAPDGDEKSQKKKRARKVKPKSNETVDTSDEEGPRVDASGECYDSVSSFLSILIDLYYIDVSLTSRKHAPPASGSFCSRSGPTRIVTCTA